MEGTKGRTQDWNVELIGRCQKNRSEQKVFNVIRLRLKRQSTFFKADLGVLWEHQKNPKYFGLLGNLRQWKEHGLKFRKIRKGYTAFNKHRSVTHIGHAGFEILCVLRIIPSSIKICYT